MLKCYRNDCTGCGVCVFSCPQEAISMKAFEEGFLYPIVDQEKCVGCAVCNQVCPVLVKRIEEKNVKGYAVQLKDDVVLKKCASGGAFYGIAKKVLQDNGVVFGVKDLGRELVYTKAETEQQLQELTGSKYYQCRITPEIYKEVVDATKVQLTLVSGTPCMVSAIKNIKGIKRCNLITLEILCQGVPDQSVVQKFYDEKEKKEGVKIITHSFRSKDYYVGRNYLNSYKFENGDVEYLVGERDPLSLSFQRQIFLRESCYRCKYANMHRVADFTVGDLWNTSSELFQREKGCSIVLCNTNIANSLIKKTNTIKREEIDFENALKDNVPFHHPVKRPCFRNWSYKLLNSKLSPTKVAWIGCYKYYLRSFIKRNKK